MRHSVGLVPRAWTRRHRPNYMADHRLTSAHSHAAQGALTRTDGASDYLRSHTAQAHGHLERSATARRLMAPSISPAEYAQVLLAWLACWEPMEAVLESMRPPGIDPARAPAARAARLYHDLELAGMGADSIRRSACDLQDAGWQERLRTLAARSDGWLGIAYVAQGALLGGALISSRLRTSLPPYLATATTFFAGAPHPPQHLAIQWRHWRGWLDLQLVAPEQQHRAAEAALATFQGMARTFDLPAHGRVH